TLDNDEKNCGVCGVVCMVPNAIPMCQAGKCLPRTCNPGWASCDGNAANGCETSILTDMLHCGGCGKGCALPNAMPHCQNGACVPDICNGAFADCDHMAPNGCETDVRTDPANCGKCGMVCLALPHSQPECSAGMCGLGPCAANWGDCDRMEANGCETDLTASK